MLPGTYRAADRFARTSFYFHSMAQLAGPREVVAAVFSTIRNASVPRGISSPAEPNIASTLWRTVSDQKNKVHYFEDTASPSLPWVNLRELDFSPSIGIRKLSLDSSAPIGGDQTKSFARAEPFTFLTAQ